MSQEDFQLRMRHKFASQVYKGAFEDDANDDERKKKEVPPPKPALNLGNICWMVAGMAVFYYTDFPIAVMYDPNVKRLWFNIGAFLIGVNLAIAAFLIVWLSKVQKIKSSEWETRFPAAIPVATAAFAFGSVCVTIGLWPVWSWFTPLILFTMFMGIVVLISILPDF